MRNNFGDFESCGKKIKEAQSHLNMERMGHGSLCVGVADWPERPRGDAK